MSFTMLALSILTLLSEIETARTMGDILKVSQTNGADNVWRSAIGAEVVQVALRSFSGRKLLFFYTKMLNKTDRMVASEALQGLMDEEVWSVTVMNDQVKLPLEEDQTKSWKEQNVVILLNNEEKFSEVLAVFIRIRVLGALSRVLLVAPSTDPEPLLLEAWHTLMHINVTTLTYSSDHITYHTLFPYEKPHRVQELDPLENLFPNKIPTNFKGYPLRVIADPREPFVMVTADGRRDGVEVRILNAIKNYSNLTVKYINYSRGREARRSYINGMAAGVFRDLSRHGADVIIGGIRNSIPRFELSEVLPSHTEEKMLWAYQRPKPKHDWSSIYRTFSITTWMLIASLIIIISGTSTLIENYQTSFGKPSLTSRFSRNLIYTWGYTLELSSTDSPETILRRAFMTVTFMYTINLACSYKSTLVTLLTTPNPGKVYEYAFEAVQDGLDVYMHHFPGGTDAELQNWDEILLPGRLHETRNFTTNLEAAANGSGIAYMLEYLSEYLINKHFLDESGKSRVFYMKTPVNVFSVCFYMAPGHPLLEQFHRKTLQLAEGGIIELLRNSILEEAMHHTIFAQEISGTTDTLRPLALSDFQAIFVVHIAALTVSAVIFILEILRHHWLGTE